VWTNRRVVAERVEALPWVASARVSIALPGELRIRIVERVAVAYLSRADGAFSVLDDGARILAVQSARPPNLPEIVGAGPPAEPGRILDAARPGLAVIAALGRDIVGRAATIDVTSGAVVRLTGTGEVRLGAVDQLAAKVAALKAVLANLAGRQVGYIDVRVPDAPVVGG
jgi:cell division septal protein FtsQ